LLKSLRNAKGQNTPFQTRGPKRAVETPERQGAQLCTFRFGRAGKRHQGDSATGKKYQRVIIYLSEENQIYVLRREGHAYSRCNEREFSILVRSKRKYHQSKALIETNTTILLAAAPSPWRLSKTRSNQPERESSASSLSLTERRLGAGALPTDSSH
jgi:hypothetical protein